jgi:hypothetical protein
MTAPAGVATARSDQGAAGRASVSQRLVWALAALAVLCVAGAAVVGGLRLHGKHSGAAALDSADNAAVSAARQETINIQTYRLKTFDADFQAALDGLTATKKVQWQANKTALKSSLTTQKIGSTATVSGAGLVSRSGDTAVVVVASDTQRVDSTGKTTTAAQNRFQVSMKLVKGKWLMDEFESVSVS